MKDILCTIANVTCIFIYSINVCLICNNFKLNIKFLSNVKSCGLDDHAIVTLEHKKYINASFVEVIVFF